MLNTPEEIAKQQLTVAKAVELEKRGGGHRLMEFNAVMQSPERENLINSVAVTRAMGESKAPELGQIIEEANRYIG